MIQQLSNKIKEKNEDGNIVVDQAAAICNESISKEFRNMNEAM